MMPDYQNIEMSFPRFERDYLRHLTFLSPALGRRGDVGLFVPPGCENTANLPLVVLLHGVFGSHWSWAFNGGAHLTAREMINAGQIEPMVLAMPSDGLAGQGSGYLPHPNADYEKWIVDDVVGCVKEVVPCLGDCSKLFLAGLSMGGYGALRLGAKHAERVSGISAHSSAADLDRLAIFVDIVPQPDSRVSQEELTVIYWMKKNRDRLPPVRFDCGWEDTLIEANRELHRELVKAGIPHEYIEFEGAHSWAYWEEHLRDTLRFFNSILE